MRDTRGRYLSIKTIAEIGPEWAHGCGRCQCGIASAPELTGVSSIYMERMVQALDGDLTFCDCQAGTRYRAALLNRRQALIEEARKDKRMVAAAQARTHPDIEATRAAMLEAYGKGTRVPTIHYDGSAQFVAETEPA